MSDLVDQFKSYNGEKKFGEDTLYVRIPWDFRDEILAALSPPQDDEVAEVVRFSKKHLEPELDRLYARVRTLEELLSTRNGELLVAENRIAELEQALGALVALKAHKDIRGKDDHYLRNQPAAWEQARKAITPPDDQSVNREEER